MEDGTCRNLCFANSSTRSVVLQLLQEPGQHIETGSAAVEADICEHALYACKHALCTDGARASLPVESHASVGADGRPTAGPPRCPGIGHLLTEAAA